MKLSEARLIREIKRKCTYQYLAEVYYSKSDPSHGVQSAGEDLCKEALKKLYPTEFDTLWVGLHRRSTKEFYKDNKSLVGDFYWWE